MQHSRSAIFSKFAERRLHPQIIPGMNKSMTLTPGPDVYNNSVSIIGQLKTKTEAMQSSSF